MPLDPRIPLGVQPAQIQNPLDVISTLAQLQGVREQTEARRLAAEEARAKAQVQQQADAAYKAAVKANPETGEVTLDYDVLLRHLPPALIPAVKKEYDGDLQRVATLRKSRLDLRKAQQEFLGSEAQTVVAAEGDPVVWGVALRAARDAEAIDPDTYQQLSSLTNPQQILALAQSYVQRAGGEAPEDRSFTLSPGQVRYGPAGEVIATGPADAPKTDDFTLSPGAVRFSPTGERIAEVPAAPPAPRDERLVQVRGPKGDLIWVRESQAVGQPAGAAPGAEGGVKLSPAQQEDIATMLTVQDLGAEALKLGDQIKWRGTGPVAGRAGAVGARWLAAGGEDAERLRNLLGNIQGTIAKLRGGTAFSAQEQAMLERYTPTAADSVLQIKAKLKSLDDFITAKRENTLRVAGGQYTPRGTPPKTDTTKQADPLGIR